MRCETREKFKHFASFLFRVAGPAGFSFIELLVAMSVAVVVLTIGLAKYNEFNRRQIVIQAVHELESNLRLAQDRALSGEKPGGWCLDNGETLSGYRLGFNSNTSYRVEPICSNAGEPDPPLGAIGSFNLPENISGPAGTGVLFKVLNGGIEGDSVAFPLSSALYKVARQVVVTKTGNIYIEEIEVPETPTPTPGAVSTPTPAPTATPVSPPLPTNTPISTPTATSTPDPGIIFADSFESGDLTAWDERVTDGGDLSASPASAYGGSFGMQALIDDATTIYVRDNLTSTSQYYARVYINPNGANIRAGSELTWSEEIVFFQLSDIGINDYLYEVGIRANTVSGYDIRMIGQNDSWSWDLISPYINVTDDWHLIEIIWRAASGPGANDGYSELIIDGISRYSKADRDTDTYLADRASLGLIRNILLPASGTIYFDDFYSAIRP